MRAGQTQLSLDFGGSESAAVAISRRRLRRETAVRLVEYAPFPRVRADQRWRAGFTVDLSADGLCLRGEVPAPAGSLLHIIVRSVDGRPTLDSIVRVVWCREHAPREWRLGVEHVAARPRLLRAPLRFQATPQAA